MPLAEVGGTMGKMSQASTVFEIKSINWALIFSEQH
jgi:hypothetical protein